MHNFSDYKLGESSDEMLSIETRQENADACLEIVKQSKLKLAIISHELDPFVYDTLEFSDAVRNLVLNGSHVEIRILVFNPDIVVKRGHLLLDIAGRLSSFIELRKPAPEYNSFNEAVLIADEVGYVFRENIERYRGKVNFNSRRESKYLLDVFNIMWDAAKPDPNFRRMHI